MDNYKKAIGKMGEDAAEKYLIKNKYKILKRNYNIRGGEIDIIAQKKDYVVFIEVKTRTNQSCGSGAEAVTYTKQQRIVKAAQHYLMQAGNVNVRFDVLEVIGEISDGAFLLKSINHIENAF